MIRLDETGPDWSDAADPRFHTYRKDSYSLHSPWFRLSHFDMDFKPSGGRYLQFRTGIKNAQLGWAQAQVLS